jgi:DeoR/GlpR family transcriptional regulator of sugar metabolism
MFTRILTDLERKRIKSYLKQDGEKEVLIRQLVSRARCQVPTIRSDLDLLEKLLKTYTGEQKKEP